MLVLLLRGALVIIVVLVMDIMDSQAGMVRSKVDSMDSKVATAVSLLVTNSKVMVSKVLGASRVDSMARSCRRVSRRRAVCLAN